MSVQRDRLRAVAPEEKRPGLRTSDRGVAGKRNALQIPPVAARRPRAGHRRVVDERAASVWAVAFDDVVVVPVRTPGEINLSAVLHLDCGVLRAAGPPALHGALLDRAVLDDHADAAGIATTDSEARVLLVHHEQALTSLAHLEPRAGERDVVVLARHAFRHVDVEYAAHREVDVVHRHSRVARAGDRDRVITGRKVRLSIARCVKVCLACPSDNFNSVYFDIAVTFPLYTAVVLGSDSEPDTAHCRNGHVERLADARPAVDEAPIRSVRLVMRHVALVPQNSIRSPGHAPCRACSAERMTCRR